MSFPFTPTIPAAPNYPGDDQPKMQQNFSSTSSALSVDHFGFNNTICGQHRRVRFPNMTSLLPQTNPASMVATAPSTANAASPQLVYKNQAGVFPTSGLRAFCVFANAAVPVFINQHNFQSITNVSGPNTQVYTITLVSGAIVNTVKPCILLSTRGITPPSTWSITGDVITLSLNNVTPIQDIHINIAVLQF